MKENLTQAERAFRILGGSLLLSMSLTQILGTWALYTGLGVLLSSALGYCLVYAALGIRQVDETPQLHSQIH